jgi:pyruvate kinase
VRNTCTPVFVFTWLRSNILFVVILTTSAYATVKSLAHSHGSQEQKKELLDMIRSVEEKYSHPIAILGDLQGPKLRVSICVGS